MWKSRRDGIGTPPPAPPLQGGEKPTGTWGTSPRPLRRKAPCKRPRRGQTTVTAGLDLRIATTSHTRTTPTGSHDREKANPSMCDLSEVGSTLGARPTAGLDLRLCKCDLSEVCGERNAAAPAPHSQRPRRGQTKVTAGLDLRIATTSHTRTTPTGSHGRVKGKSFYVRPLRGREHLGGLVPPAGQDLRLCKCDLSEVSGERNRGPAALHAPQGPFPACRLRRSPMSRQALPSLQGRGRGRGSSPLPAGEGPGVGLPFHGGSGASHLISI